MQNQYPSKSQPVAAQRAPIVTEISTTKSKPGSNKWHHTALKTLDKIHRITLNHLNQAIFHFFEVGMMFS
jgi:hypothetical protein